MDRAQPGTRDTRPLAILALAIVAFTLATAYIHFSLGGLLFTLNAVGFVGLAFAMTVIAIVSHPLVWRFDWLPRVGLAGYTATTIGAYLVMGPYFSLGWTAKAIEVGILVLLAADFGRAYGTPAGLIAAALASVGLGTQRAVVVEGASQQK
jgi:hypothetical protein